MSLSVPFIQRWSIQQWLKSSRYALLETRDQILTDEDLKEGTLKVLGFVAKLILSRNPNAANRVLERLFKLRDFTAGYLDTQFSLELFWKSFGGRPSNTPWSKWSSDQLIEGKIKYCVDPDHATFFGGWTCTENIERSQKLLIQDDYNTHQWKDSQDMWTHAICALILCKPVGVQMEKPKRENLEEAFEVVEKLFSVIPLRDGVTTPGDVFPVDVYFMLAVHLGHEARAREILKMVIEQKDRWWLGNFFIVPAFYEVLAAEDDPPVKFDDDVEMEEAEEVISTALNSRAEKGSKLPMQDVPIAELLRRFSEGAFFVYNEAYLDNGINEPEKVLRPPLTEEEVAGVEERLGQPLPPDLKELVLIADGFNGTWHFAGGGWGGIKNSLIGSAANYETYLGFEPEPEIKTVTREDGSTYQMSTIGGCKNDFGDVWWSSGAVECDDFEHIICPPPTWKKLQEAMGKTVEEGEYAVMYCAHWTDGGEGVYPSLRVLIAKLTIELERQVAVGWRGAMEE